METVVVMAVRKLGYIEPTLEQSNALQAFVRGNDILVYLPTGTGKSSLCYATRQAIYFWSLNANACTARLVHDGCCTWFLSLSVCRLPCFPVLCTARKQNCDTSRFFAAKIIIKGRFLKPAFKG